MAISPRGYVAPWVGEVKPIKKAVPLYQVDYYSILVGRSLFSEDKQPISCYQIINKNTNVIEAECTELPRAIIKMRDLNEYMINFHEEEKADSIDKGAPLQ